jgi:hypothetical protein
MTEDIKPMDKKLSRREALTRTLGLLGLTAAVAYTVPTVLTISEAQADSRTRRRFRRRTERRRFVFRRRTDRRFRRMRRRTFR